MIKDKTKLLIAVLIFLIILIVIIQIFRPNNQPQAQQDQGKLPTFQPNDASGNISFYVTRNTAPTQPMNVAQQFTITFSQPLNPNSLQYEISPKIDLILSLDNTGKILTIAPETTWNYNTSYTLKISKETLDNNGKTLNNDAIIYFKTGAYTGI